MKINNHKKCKIVFDSVYPPRYKGHISTDDGAMKPRGTYETHQTRKTFPGKTLFEKLFARMERLLPNPSKLFRAKINNAGRASALPFYETERGFYELGQCLHYR